MTRVSMYKKDERSGIDGAFGNMVAWRIMNYELRIMN